MLIVSPPQTSRYPIVRQDINLFSQFIHSIRETFTDNDISQLVNVDLQRILAWFIKEYFVHKKELISTARK